VTVAIRPATEDDFDAVIALWNTDADPDRTIIDEPGHLHRLLAARPGSLLVAIDASTPLVGTIIAAWDGWRGNLYRLVVAADCRRQGVARQLVAAAEQKLRSEGCQRVSALVSLGLPEAPRFWPAAGYRRDEAVGRFVRNL
jgi:ribosomal protein S18 acetylase RimI-like enzyme